MKTVIRLTLILGLLFPGPATAAELFPLSDVRVLGGPLEHAQTLNGEHLMRYDPDRLLAPFRTEAGLEPRAEVYPNWEANGLNGHTAGHYLSALANHYAATGDERFRDRLAYMVAELARCQDAAGDGYVGGVPGSAELWDQIARGDVRASGFDLNGRWVPWYNLHKTFAGLRDAWAVAGNEQARAVLVRLSDWCLGLIGHLSDEQMQHMMVAEFGGMNEVLADVAQITGEQKYLDAAVRFNHHLLLAPLADEQDRLNGMHANTQVPKVIGFEQIAQMTGDRDLHTAAEFFWQAVTGTRSLAFGGNSVHEHFAPLDQAEAWLTARHGPETCNTYNMLRLTELLFERSPEARYAAYYERALFNHILSSQHPEHGGYVYYTPVIPQHYRVYSEPGENFWCCVGSGMENHTRYGQFIYAHGGDALYVNLFVTSEVNWRERGVVLRQDTGFPEAASTRLTVQAERPTRFRMMVRRPAWSDGDDDAVTVNGEPVEANAQPGSYLEIDREWRGGDVVEVRMSMRVHTEPMPNLPAYQAVMYGPLVLAAPTTDWGMDVIDAAAIHQDQLAVGPLIPLNESPMLVADPGTIADHVTPVEGEPLTFRAEEIIRPGTFESLTLIPFYKVHDSRYMMYWRTIDPASYERVREELARAEARRMAIERATVDQLTPGQQQPEVDHNFRGEETTTGIWQDRHFRHATGWFSYDLNTAGETDLNLRVTYFGSDHRRFDILIDGRVLETVTMQGPRPGAFFDATYPIDPDWLDGVDGNTITVTFRAHDGSMAGGIYDVRLMRRERNAMAAYLMVYFLDDTHDLHMAVSTDGYSFTALNGGEAVLDSHDIALQQGIRDPHITRGPDNRFYMAMTDLHIFAQREGLRDTEWERPGERFGWGNNRAIVLMHSDDLIRWDTTSVRIDQAFDGLEDIGCAWAPQLIYDEDAGRMMLYYTMRFGNGPNRLYWAYLNDDCTALDTEPRVLFEYPKDVSAIDGDITKIGDRYHLFYVAHDGVPGIKQAVSDRINGGYEYLDAWVDPEPGHCEAPNVWQRIGEEAWVLMYDVYSIHPHNFAFSETTDFEAFTHLGRFNEGVMTTTNFSSPKHGAVIHITREEAQRLVEHWADVDDETPE